MSRGCGRVPGREHVLLQYAKGSGGERKLHETFKLSKQVCRKGASNAL